MTRATSASLWLMLDKDGSGTVSRDEFRDALLQMQSSKARPRPAPMTSHHRLTRLGLAAAAQSVPPMICRRGYATAPRARSPTSAPSVRSAIPRATSARSASSVRRAGHR